MRGNQEAYILVKVKDGKKYVCAINKLKTKKTIDHSEHTGIKLDLEKDVLWH